ncbi:hypothetical protein ACHHYP_08680 [Achlya hypogyna]|uniref:Uncharacterized protein n=1 Tax=Achlya hypogyna TaxID=1202772 RepID=A0A1V9ZK64_ACHHY|nr:hypothetical protein ACHHYP_08680 [Achlya hypogyna]
MTATPGLMLCYCTDVEGNIDYFNRYVALSEGLFFDADGSLDLHHGYIFVFGGDAGDKGLGTLRMYRLLVDLKTKYPDRVVLIAGNRDVNKMRFTSELTEEELDLATMSPDLVDGPLWVPSNHRVSVVDFLCRNVLKRPRDDVTPAELAAVNTKINRVKWMLTHTMGSDGDFERRRTELGGDTVSDDAVVESFEASVTTGGLLRQYLQLCVLGFVHGTTLFVHGGIMNKDGLGCLGFVPSATTMNLEEPIRHWIARLNAWYDAQLAEWSTHPTWTPGHGMRGGEALQNYGLSNATHSVINGRHLHPSGMPRLLPDAMVATLWDQGIRRVVMGHTPHGIAPTVVKQPAPSGGVFESIMCDTSYSDTSKSDNRGNCVSALVIDGDRVTLRGYIHTAAIQEDFEFATSDEEYVGYQLPHNGPWIKLRTNDGAYLICTVSGGFTYKYEEMDAAAVAKAMASHI